MKAENLRIQNKQLELQLVKDYLASMRLVLGLTDEQIKQFEHLSDNDNLVELKMLLATFRRVLPIAELQNESKATLQKDIGPIFPDGRH